MKIALYQPEIPQNVGAFIRLCACLGVDLEIIEPCGFPWVEKKIRQSAMDYYDALKVTRHESWGDFKDAAGDSRIVLMTTKTDLPYTQFEFKESDILLAGRESAGAPEEIHGAADGRITIPMYGEMRSLNIVNASAMIVGEALRQVRH